MDKLDPEVRKMYQALHATCLLRTAMKDCPNCWFDPDRSVEPTVRSANSLPNERPNTERTNS